VAFWLKPLLELTAAGTVAEFHGIPFYPFPVHCAAKVGRIPYDVQILREYIFWADDDFAPLGLEVLAEVLAQTFDLGWCFPRPSIWVNDCRPVGAWGCFLRPSIWVDVFPDLRSGLMWGLGVFSQNFDLGWCFPRPSIWVDVFPDLRSGLMFSQTFDLG
jgi:hypothetical protein